MESLIKILLVEDELHIAEGILFNLKKEKFEVALAKDGNEGLMKWQSWNPDLIVLDIMLPVLDGFSLLKHIRLKDERIPVLILTAKADIEDKIKGFSSGVDDYMTKPFNLEEFILRIRALLKRAAIEKNDRTNQLNQLPKIVNFGTNTIDFENYTAVCNAGTIQLTEQEIILLKILLKNKGKAVSRKTLLETGLGYKGTLDTRTIDNFMVRFRKYFETDHKNPVYFKSLRSVGYIFEDIKESETRQ